MIAGAPIATHAIAMPDTSGYFDLIAVIAEPGLHFTLPDRHFHYALPDRHFHFELVTDNA